MTHADRKTLSGREGELDKQTHRRVYIVRERDTGRYVYNKRVREKEGGRKTERQRQTGRERVTDIKREKEERDIKR